MKYTLLLCVSLLVFASACFGQVTIDKPVGIGTSPATYLHVLGNTANEIARFQPATNAANSRGFISLYTTNADYWWEFSNEDAAGGGLTNGLAFRERSGTGATPTARVYFASGGNVGIGTTSPGALLTVNAAAPEVRLTQTSFDNMAAVRIYSKGTNTSARSALWLQNDDNGDGTGTVRIQGILAANSINVGFMAGNGINNSLQLYTPQALPLQLGTANTARLTILGNGNVGIGKTDPTYTLEVQGTERVIGNVTIEGLTTINAATVIGGNVSAGGTGSIGTSLAVGTSLTAATLNGAWDQGGAASGYVRLGKVLICWGNFTSTTTNTPTGGATFPGSQAFVGTYTLQLTCDGVATGNPPTGRWAAVYSKSNTSFVAQSFQPGGGASAQGGQYLAIGVWQ